MRVVHAIRSDGFAGVERHVALLARAQARAGHDVSVIGGDTLRMRAAVSDPSVELVAASTVRAVRAAVRAAGWADVVHAHMTAAELAAATAHPLSSPPIVVTRHFAGRRGSTSVARATGRLIQRRISAQIAISRYVAEHVEGDSTVVHPGVVEPQRSGAPREKVVLVAQRLEAEKDTDVAIRAFSSSGLSAQGWRLRIAGDGAERDRLLSMLREADLAESAELLGHRDDIEDLMQTSSILLAPCAREGLGLTVLEAMAAGLPVVAAAAGGHLETVGAVPGAALFESGDATAAAAAVRTLAEDEVARTAYARDALAVQRQAFTLDAQQSSTEQVYRRVLA